MITSAAIYHVLHFFHVTIDIRNVCVFLAPLFSSFTTIVTYHLTKELKVRGRSGRTLQAFCFTEERGLPACLLERPLGAVSEGGLGLTTTLVKTRDFWELEDLVLKFHFNTPFLFL